MSVCLMSIKPKWAKELYSGKKTVEFRKTAPQPGSIVFLYETAPVQAVTGVFQAMAVLSGPAEIVWGTIRVLGKVWSPGTVTQGMLADYARGGNCCAIIAGFASRFEPGDIVKLEKFGVRPPQSWQSLRATNAVENRLASALLNILRKGFAAKKKGGANE